ncbi:hypothetical protein M5585_06645 [Serratia ureilytica]
MFRLTLATRRHFPYPCSPAGRPRRRGGQRAADAARRSYFLQAQAQLQQRLKQTPNTNRAKNVILVVGDGMGFPP